MEEEKIIYSKEQFTEDEKMLRKAESGLSPIDYSSFKRLMIHDLCANTDVLEDNRICGFYLRDIKEALINPVGNYKLLVELSRQLMRTSSIYMRVNNYFANMGLFNYRIDCYDLNNKNEKSFKNLKNDYINVVNQFEKMNLKNEFGKIMSSLFCEDVFYGIILEDKSDFFIFKLPFDICEICQIQDGVYNFRIALYNINPINIGSYPTIIQKAYIKYRNNEDYIDGWYLPPAEKQICLKMNDTTLKPIPFLIMLLKDILDIETYKKLKLQKARVDNYKAIIITVPIDKNHINKPLLTEEILIPFAELNKANMPEDVGLIHAPGEAEAVSFKDNSNNANNLSDAIENTYREYGLPKQLFGEESSSVALKLSIEKDASIVYKLYRQFERWACRYIKLKKFNKPNYKFALRIQDSTVFNRDSVAESYLKASQNGLPFKIDYAIALGQTQGRFIGNLVIENDVFELHNHMIPLSTSYTMSSDSIGRPTNESKGEELTDSGEVTKDSDANENR